MNTSKKHKLNSSAQKKFKLRYEHRESKTNETKKNRQENSLMKFILAVKLVCSCFFFKIEINHGGNVIAYKDQRQMKRKCVDKITERGWRALNSMVHVGSDYGCVFFSLFFFLSLLSLSHTSKTFSSVSLRTLSKLNHLSGKTKTRFYKTRSYNAQCIWQHAWDWTQREKK